MGTTRFDDLTETMMSAARERNWMELVRSAERALREWDVQAISELGPKITAAMREDFLPDEQPAREGTTRTTMATKNPELEKLTKAQLIERLQQEMHRANTLEHEKERVKEEYNVAATSHADTMGRLEKAVKECEALKVGVKERERDINRLEGDLVDRIREAKDWKNAFLEEQRGKRKANTLLVQQAHLAGEIARLVTVADTNKN